MSENESTSSDGSPRKISAAPMLNSPSPNKGKRPQAPRSLRDPVPLKKSKYDNEVMLKILLPNETHFKFRTDASRIYSVKFLLHLVKTKASEHQLEKPEREKAVEWGPNTVLENVAPGRDCKKLNNESIFKMMTAAKRSSTITFLVNDGREDASYCDPGMWNVTPKPEMLGRLPQGYTLETALAEHIDNAIQAVFDNKPGCDRKVSVYLRPDEIVVFDTGPGMDANENGENCIKNWGTLGASTHRNVHCKALGGEAPYLTPFLGKYGVGGVTAAFHLGGCVDVCSTRRDEDKVVSLRIELNALVQRSRDESPQDSQQGIWRAPGSFRDMTCEERKLSPHGSFTKVVITKLKQQYCIGDDTKHDWEVENVRQLLTDIYYPYIQTEVGSSARIVFPLQFEVNGVDLGTVQEECETGISNLHTCIGKPFEFTIQMLTKAVAGHKDKERKPTKIVQAANARIICRYYPNLKGKEQLEAMVEKLHLLRPRDRPQTFQTINRVVVRWLGRLLPQVKWPAFPFMEPPVKKEQKELRTWAKRVRAFVDTDAGFHPVQSKTDLDRSQPFVDALKNIGGSLDKHKVDGVEVSIKHCDKKVTPLEFANLYLKWVTEMHNNFDEELVTAADDQERFIFKHYGNCFENLGLGKSQGIVLHTHMKDSKNEWKIDERNPICLKIPKGQGLKADKCVTLEYFFHDVTADDPGVQLNFLCRGIEVDASEGCEVTKLPEGVVTFQLKRSQWYPAAVLNTAKRLDFEALRKEKEKILNKRPLRIEVLNDEETNRFESCEAFPVDGSSFDAGFSLPKGFIAVIRPTKGSGVTFKQGCIFPDPLEIKMTVTHRNCSNLHVPDTDDSHTQEVFSLLQKSSMKNGVKGLYEFSFETSEFNHLVKKGTYTFQFTVESEKYKYILPAVSSIEIVPSAITSKWTFCNHPGVHCMISDHENTEDTVQPVVIRLNEPIEQILFVQKYDQYGNSQAFETPLELDLFGVTSKGDSLNMHTKVQSSTVAGTGERQRLLLKDFCFPNGSFKQLGSADEALLQACIAGEQLANIKCTVLPGVLENIEITSSEPPVLMQLLSFDKSLKPGEVIKNLRVQGLDSFMNRIDKGQTVRVLLDGVEFQDDCGSDRVVDENGTLQLGGLIKVTCLYNSTGSIAFYSDTKLLSSITFKTLTRRLHVDQVPVEAYVGRKLEGICVKMIDEWDNVDSSVGADHSIGVDWQPSVTYSFIKGECILPSFEMPEKPGLWQGHIFFSTDTSLCALLMVELKLAAATSLGPPGMEREDLTTECGKKITFHFKVSDDHQKPTSLTDSQRESIDIHFEPNEDGNETHPGFRSITVEHKEVKLSRVDGTYEAHITVSGSAGMYIVTLTDKSLLLEGKVQAVCRLQHGPVSQLLLARLDGTLFSEYEDSDEGPVPIIEVKRGSHRMPELTVMLLDTFGNVCSSCNERTLKMTLLSQMPLLKDIQITRGVGILKCSDLEARVGRYQVLIEFERFAEDLYSLGQQTNPLLAHFSLRVHPGNYPSLLSLSDSDPVAISLTHEEIQYVPPMSVLVESADGLRLQSRLKVGVKLVDDRSPPSSDPKQYFGELMESCDPQVDSQTGLTQDQAFSSYPAARYDFKEVLAPSQAGTYRMEFSVVDSDVDSPHRILIVRHGPPNRILISERAKGREISEHLKVNIVDAYSNICESIGGLQLNLKFTLQKSFTGTLSLSPSTICSKCTALVEEGNGDFGAFRVTRGIPGIYTLEVSAVQGNVEMDLKPLIAHVCAIEGNINQSLAQLLQQNRDSKVIDDCERRIAKCQKDIQFKQAEIQQFENARHNLEEELIFQENERNSLIAKAQLENDEAILNAEKDQPVRDYHSVIQDLRLTARNSASLAFWESLGSRTLSQEQRRDFVGLVVTLARVENDSLNRMLVEYLGRSTLLLIVTRTQRAIDELEVRDPSGQVDENIGLHGFARSRGYHISGRFEALALMDTRPYKPARGPSVDMKHRQRILNIDPPLLPSRQVPEGFLGYAVNLVYLNVQQLQMRVQTRSQGEVGLRESLFFHLFQTLQVYDKQRNMVSAKERLRKFSNGAISLDGGLIKPNGRQQLGRLRSKLPIRFGLVPYEERLEKGSMMHPACVAIERQRKGIAIESRIASIQNDLRSLTPIINGGHRELSELKTSLNHDEKQQQMAQESSTSSESLIVELQRAAGRAAQLQAATNDDSPNRSRSNSQGSAGRMRTFFM